MAITFSPAIGEQVPVPVAPWHLSPTGLLQVKLTARLSVAEYRQLEQKYAKVQVWSDFPCYQRSEGQWGEMDFELDAEESASDESQVMLASSQESQGEVDQGIVRLSIKIAVPYYGQGRQYQFTYRIFHSSESRIEWLGSFGHNGVFRLEPTSNGDSSLSLQSQGWDLSGGPENSFVWNSGSSERKTTTVTVAKASADQKNWSVWALGRDSSLYRSTCEDASLLFLVPRADTFAFLCPNILAFASSPDSSLSFSPLGEVQVSGPGSVILQPFHPSAGSFLERILSHSSSPMSVCRKHSDAIMTLNSSSTRILPVHVAVFPLTQDDQVPISQARFSPGELVSYLGPQSPQFAISNSNGDVFFVDPEGQDAYDVSISVPSSGGEFSLAPVYPFSRPQSRPNDIKLSILTKHTPVASQLVSDEILPTPPPSPQLRPIAHLSPRHSNLTDLGTTHGNESSASISDIGIPSRVESPMIPHALPESAQTTRPMSKLAHQISISSSSSATSTSVSLQDNHSHRVRRRSNYLVACMRHFFFATSVFFMIFLRRIFPFFFYGRRTTPAEPRQRISTETTEVDGNENVGVDSAEETGASVPADERTPLLSREQRDAPSTSTPSAPEEATEPVVAASPMKSSVSQGSASPSLTVTVDLLGSEGNHKLAFFGGMDLGEVEKIQFDVDGETVEVAVVKQIRDGYLVELNWTKGGRLRARYPL
ncbi:hypothetical protein Moror_235 [Moniliophthora roreri MCA 2997]|uniref:Uncharacterized protein n=1 Tax=Moniliophthora roreri (strain MCA 2997) TaxID=1381753 RepID=V2Y152_MONRO|nr:hypothetical protein Moror_235 [Moniliophthora roreri MCA 2997]